MDIDIEPKMVENASVKQSMWWGTLGTIRPALPFDPYKDALQIHKALEMKNVDVMMIVKILTDRTNTQRQSIAAAYKTLAQKDVSVTLKKAVSGGLQELLISLTMTPARFQAFRLRQAMEGLGTDEEALLEVLCTQTADQLRNITIAYHEDYGRNLENDLISETSKDFTKLVLALLKKEELNKRDSIDIQMIYQDVKTLSHSLASKKADALPWIQVLTSRSPDHLKKVFCKLEDQNEEQVDKIIQKRFSGDVRLGLHALVCSIQNTQLYLAQRLHSCMKKNSVVGGIMVGRSEQDLLGVRVEFLKLNNLSLYSTIQKEFKGDLQLALLALCRSEDG